MISKLVTRVVNNEVWFFVAVVVSVLLIATLLVMMTAIPINYFSTLSSIETFKSVQTTIKVARENNNLSPLELAALQHKIIDSNAWLRTAQYWNSFPVLSWYYPESITELKPLE